MPVQIDLETKELKLCIADRLAKLKRASLKFQQEFGTDSPITKETQKKIAALQKAYSEL